MPRSIVILLPALAFCAAVASAQTTAPTNTRIDPAVEEFMTLVTGYVEVHRVLAIPLIDLRYGSDADTARARRAHRLLIDEARALAQLPKIFTPRVSQYLRGQIRQALNSFPPEGEHWPVATALDTLPPLPTALSYRLEGPDLMLVDVDGDLVVDVLEDALPGSVDEDPALDPEEMCAPEPLPLMEGSPCDAHGELDMCWS